MGFAKVAISLGRHGSILIIPWLSTTNGNNSNYTQHSNNVEAQFTRDQFPFNYSNLLQQLATVK